MPMPVNQSTKPGLNFPDALTMKITPTAALKPQNAISRSLFSQNFASVIVFLLLKNEL